MSNDKNIENFDSFFKDAFNSFEPTPPKGVFEAIQSQVGASAGTGAAGTATTVAKAGAWGIGKIIVGVVGTLAVATTIYLSVNNTNSTTTQNNGSNEQGNSSTAQIITSDQNKGIKEGDKEVLSQGTSETNNTNTEELSTNTQAQSNSSFSSADNSTFVDENLNSNDVNNSNNNGDNETQSTFNDGGEELSTDNNEVNREVVGLYLSEKQLCANERLTVAIADDLSKYKYIIDFGDGASATTKLGKSTSHRYSTAGKYKVTAKEVNGKKIAKEQWVEVRKVVAKFKPQLVEKATFRFTNQSQNAVHYNWFFGDASGEVSRLHSPTHTFKSFTPENYKVKLIAMDNVGCLDSFSAVVKKTYTYEHLKPKMYNVFSPGTDGRNDHYEVEIENEEKYHLVVLNKNGTKVFESFTKEKTWSGKNLYNGEDCAAGNYIIVFSYKIKGFKEQQEKVFVTLVR